MPFGTVHTSQLVCITASLPPVVEQNMTTLDSFNSVKDRQHSWWGMEHRCHRDLLRHPQIRTMSSSLVFTSSKPSTPTSCSTCYMLRHSIIPARCVGSHQLISSLSSMRVILKLSSYREDIADITRLPEALWLLRFDTLSFHQERHSDDPGCSLQFKGGRPNSCKVGTTIHVG